MIELGDVWKPVEEHLYPKSIAHYWILLSYKNSEGKVLCVNMTEYNNESVDDTCILTPGEYPLLYKDTTIAYSLAQLFSADKLEEAIHKNIVTQHPSINQVTLRRIALGALDSRHLSYPYKAMIPSHLYR